MNKLAIIGGLGALGAGAVGTAGVTGNLPLSASDKPIEMAQAADEKERDDFPALLKKPADALSRAEEAAREMANQATGRDAIKFCLTWVEDGTTCLTRRELLAKAADPLMKQRVAMSDGKPKNVAEIPMKVKLADPVDYEAPEREIRDCAAFNELKSQGWGGLTSADMADEQWFMTRCGLYKMAEMADIATATAFEKERLTTDDLKGLAASAWPQIGEAGDEAETGDMPMTLRKPASGNTLEESDRFWVAQYSNMQTLVSEVSHADFTGDGQGDILVLMNARAKEGTARYSFYGVIEKTSKGITLQEASVY